MELTYAVSKFESSPLILLYLLVLLLASGHFERIFRKLELGGYSLYPFIAFSMKKVFHFSPSICPEAAFQQPLPPTNFPLAENWCSNLKLLSE